MIAVSAQCCAAKEAHFAYMNYHIFNLTWIQLQFIRDASEVCAKNQGVHSWQMIECELLNDHFDNSQMFASYGTFESLPRIYLNL